MIQTLYKRSKLKKIQIWSIEISDGKYRTHEGFQDGQITVSEWTVCVSKNIGSSNQTTPQQQALKEVEAKIKKKKEQGYCESIESIDIFAKKISPMLAFKYDDYKHLLEDDKYYTQPKLDGIRCIATENGLFTRNGKSIVSVPHIVEELKSIFTDLPKGIKIDGELYNHELKNDFNKITSLVRKTVKLTDKDFEDSKNLIQYHVYDIDIIETPFENRISLLQKVITNIYKYIKLVSTSHLMNIKEELDLHYFDYLQQGYEGQMIREGDSYYENNRSKFLLKRKEFKDEEFEIIDIEEGVGNRSGMMGRIKFKTKGGKEFDSNARGTYDYFKDLLINKSNYIGKLATVRYQNLTPDGIPRFPVMISVRDYE